MYGMHATWPVFRTSCGDSAFFIKGCGSSALGSFFIKVCGISAFQCGCFLFIKGCGSLAVQSLRVSFLKGSGRLALGLALGLGALGAFGLGAPAKRCCSDSFTLSAVLIRAC